MPPHSLALLLAAASSAAMVLGCGEPTGTRGQLGNLRFAYSLPGTCEGCSLEREVLAGSVVDVEVHNINHKVNYLVRSSAPEIMEVQFSPRCRYVGEVDCFENVVLETKRAGDADLEVFDEWTGTVLDRVTVKVRDAATIHSRVRAASTQGGPAADVSPSPSGVFELKVDTDVEIVSVARSVEGTELLAAGGAIRGIYTNDQIVGPRPVYVVASTTEYAKAKTPGATTVAVAGGGVRQELPFRVLN